MSLVFKDGIGSGEMFTKSHDPSKLTATEKTRAAALKDKIASGQTLSMGEMREIIKMRARIKKGR